MRPVEGGETRARERVARFIPTVTKNIQFSMARFGLNRGRWEVDPVVKGPRAYTRAYTLGDRAGTGSPGQEEPLRRYKIGHVFI